MLQSIVLYFLLNMRMLCVREKSDGIEQRFMFYFIQFLFLFKVMFVKHLAAQFIMYTFVLFFFLTSYSYFSYLRKKLTSFLLLCVL